MITAVPEEQAAAFALLRRSQVPSDLLPEERWERYQTGLLRRRGLSPALARRASTPLGNVWLIPGDGWICFSLADSSDPSSLDGGGLVCNRTENAVAAPMVTWTSSESAQGTIVQGVVPDGIAEVALTAGDGSTAPVVVVDNVFGAVLNGALSCVSVNGATVLNLGVSDQ